MQHVPSLINFIQVEALEEKMSHLRGELAAKEEHLTQVSISPIPACINRNNPVSGREDVMLITTKLTSQLFPSSQERVSFFLN